MILSVKERILLLNVMPKPGAADFPTMKVKASLENLIGFDEEEIKELEMVVDEKGTRWNDQKEIQRDFLLTEAHTALISGIFNKFEYTALIKKFCS